MITFAFSFLFPFLVLLLVVQCVAKGVKKMPQGWRLTTILALISGIIILLPVRGLPLARWFFGINANFSLPLMAIAFHKAWENATGSRVLDHNAAMASRIFGLAAGLGLYPMALGIGGFDPYALGWDTSWLSVFLLIVTIVLLLMKNRFAVVLIACILGYDLHLLESSNLWDYLVDPFFTLLSFGALIHSLIGIIHTAISGKKGMDALEKETARTG